MKKDVLQHVDAEENASNVVGIANEENRRPFRHPTRPSVRFLR